VLAVVELMPRMDESIVGLGFVESVPFLLALLSRPLLLLMLVLFSADDDDDDDDDRKIDEVADDNNDDDDFEMEGMAMRNRCRGRRLISRTNNIVSNDMTAN